MAHRFRWMAVFLVVLAVVSVWFPPAASAWVVVVFLAAIGALLWVLERP
jgi:sugar phosphate permease